MSISSSMLLIVGGFIIIISFLKIIFTHTDASVMIALGMILLALGSILSEMESQTAILKSIKEERGNIPDKIIEGKEGGNTKEE